MIRFGRERGARRGLSLDGAPVDQLQQSEDDVSAGAVRIKPQGLAGGVKPLQVEIPESGKLLLLAGVLPPPAVGVELEVKANRG